MMLCCAPHMTCSRAGWPSRDEATQYDLKIRSKTEIFYDL